MVNLTFKLYTYAGSLALNTLDFQSLTSLILGNATWGQLENLDDIAELIENIDGNYWSSESFRGPIFQESEFVIEIAAKEFKFSENLVAHDASFNLIFGSDQLVIRNLVGKVESGKITGDLLVRNSSGDVEIDGDVQLDGVPIEGFVWDYQNVPVVSGFLDLDIDFEGSGRSMVGIIGGLTGGGNYSIKNGEISGIDPSAFNQVLNAVDEGLELEESNIENSFENRLFDISNLSFQGIDRNFVVTAGQIQTRNIEINSADMKIALDAGLDLEKLTLESNWSILKDLPEVIGATPQIKVSFSGPISQPDPNLDVTDFISYLTLRALELETQKQESQNALILERERLFRELRQIKTNIERREVEKELAKRELQEQSLKNDEDNLSNQNESESLETENEIINPDTSELNEESAIDDAFNPESDTNKHQESEAENSINQVEIETPQTDSEEIPQNLTDSNDEESDTGENNSKNVTNNSQESEGENSLNQVEVELPETGDEEIPQNSTDPNDEEIINDENNSENANNNKQEVNDEVAPESELARKIRESLENIPSQPNVPDIPPDAIIKEPLPALVQ